MNQLGSCTESSEGFVQHCSVLRFFPGGLTAHEHEADCEYFLCLRVGRDVAEAHGRQAGYREIDRRYVAGLEGAAECRSLVVLTSFKNGAFAGTRRGGHSRRRQWGGKF